MEETNWAQKAAREYLERTPPPRIEMTGAMSKIEKVLIVLMLAAFIAAVVASILFMKIAP